MLPSDIGPVTRTPPAPPATNTPSANLTQSQQRELALRYAPILYFHPDERNFLQDPMTFIEQSTLRQERDFRPDKELYGLGGVPADQLPAIGPGNATADGQIFLDHQNEKLGDGVRAGDLDNSVNLYQYDPKTNTITYFLFYSYNDGAPGNPLSEAGNHEGDWERITIQLDDQFQPTEVRYSAHDGQDVSRSWADAPKEDGRPVAFVAKGSHANYPEPGSWGFGDGLLGGLFADDVRPGGQRFDLATQPARDVTAEPYYGSYVLWGERGTLQEVGKDFTSGPTGPSPDKGPILEADPREPDG